MHLNLRTATDEDLDHLATIMCAAFPADPQWDYRFPRRKDYPEDHYKATREMCESMLKEKGVCINVVTTPVKIKGKEYERPIALAVWELHYEKTSTFTDVVKCAPRRDADPKRMDAFDNATLKAKTEYFDHVYGDQQIHLRILGTHPDFQRCGAGSQHCRWGMNLAHKHEVPVTILSSPLGQQLYTHLGFDHLAYFPVHVQGEEEQLSVGVMVKHCGGQYMAASQGAKLLA
ncbi:hypothetical protein EJ05DRAFT_183075 [Pseudovirgaria hyperparasitica]|uniref:N-acetyltransferase domain-containing protein n=1 Tax=Pseudovirgaria hyperparasitica TaxID=470096 RepID=A0A6A6WJU8_9PEZI|nr:uncharacterized protein EJ05DRAFT_183075 [Pseudovirgaria hyperparasitica]KAF2761731.1 hypothetical protein EJ05DRAFT_183075 [Pseudovirgaria hyperparasitica]